MKTEHFKVRGTLTISRPRGGDGPDYAEIKVYDESSSTGFVTVRVALEQFAEALFGLSNVECEFDLRAARVGKIREHKTEIVPLDGKGYYAYGSAERKQVAAAALAPFEVDGWKGHVDDLFNQHRHTPNGYRVTFVRYVDAVDETKE